MVATWNFRARERADADWMAELWAEVMRPDLARLGRYDSERVRQRFVDAFVPAYTRVIVADAQDVGLVAVRPAAEALWLEHFYLASSHQGRGIGRAVLTDVLAEGGSSLLLHLNVLQGSPARRTYERHGFTLGHEDPIDVYLKAAPLRIRS